jgi:hypothetical protein
MKIEDVIFVPYAATPEGIVTRWIENYEGTAGDRNLIISHCRFGGENTGLSHVIVNYADNYWYSQPPTKIKIEDTMMYSNTSTILLMKMPNSISINNCNGNDGLLIKADSSLNIDAISPGQVSIALDNTTRGDIPSGQLLFSDEKLYKFVNQQFLTSNRFNNYSYKSNKPLAMTAGTTFDIPLKLSPYPGSDSGNSFGLSVGNTGFFLSISSYVAGNAAYTANCLFYVSLSSGHDGSVLKTQVNFTKIASAPGGATNFGTTLDITSIYFNATTSNRIDTYSVDGTTFLRVTMNNSLHAKAKIQIIPMMGIEVGSTLV